MKKNILFLILLMLMVFTMGVGAATLFSSNQVLYKNNTTIENALNDLYSKSNYGDATASDIKVGKTALVNGEHVVGTASFSGLTVVNSQNASNLASYTIEEKGNYLFVGVRGITDQTLSVNGTLKSVFTYVKLNESTYYANIYVLGELNVGDVITWYNGGKVIRIND